MNVNGANQETLRRAEKKLCELAKELKKNWDLRQNKTKLQKSTQEAFAIIHNSSLEETLASMIELLKKVISALPPSQSELFDVQDCYPGFMEWNEIWSNFQTLKFSPIPHNKCEHWKGPQDLIDLPFFFRIRFFSKIYSIP